jgi:hypothetical protein
LKLSRFLPKHDVCALQNIQCVGVIAQGRKDERLEINLVVREQSYEFGRIIGHYVGPSRDEHLSQPCPVIRSTASRNNRPQAATGDGNSPNFQHDFGVRHVKPHGVPILAASSRHFTCGSNFLEFRPS